MLYELKFVFRGLPAKVRVYPAGAWLDYNGATEHVDELMPDVTAAIFAARMRMHRQRVAPRRI